MRTIHLIYPNREQFYMIGNMKPYSCNISVVYRTFSRAVC